MHAAELGTRAPVGVLAAGVAGLAFATHPLGADAVIAAFLAAVLVVIAAIDIRSLIIPNRIVLPVTAIVLMANIAMFPDRATEFLLAAAVAGVVLLLPNLVGGAIGMGDVKLGLLLGVALGWGVIGALELACLALFPVALFVLVRGGRQARKAALPFGPFMAFGALFVMIVPRLAAW